MERLHVQPVARQYARLVAPALVGRWLAAAGRRLVDHVVVNEGCRMNDLRDRSKANSRLVGRAKRPREQQNEHRTQAFASARLQMVGDRRDRFDRTDSVEFDRLFDLGEVRGDERHDFGARQRRRP